MPDVEMSQMAHLMRRAGFGATRTELESLTARGYDRVVDELVNPELVSGVDEDILDRYYGGEPLQIWIGTWFFRMVNGERPLVEKMALFWHQVFATGIGKTEHPPSSVRQIEMFQRVGMTDLRTILLALSRDPAMIFWLDNNENKDGEPNENYGRELLELFSMGVGNYTENDIKDAARAFTGWTFVQPLSQYPFGHYDTEFEFRPDEHDYGQKTFLGRTGNFDGKDIIDIVVEQPATARFICRHLYNFFVADEPQVPAWPQIPCQDPEALETMVQAYMESSGDIRRILSVLFKSDFFKAARLNKVKSPTELVAGVMKLTGQHRQPDPGIMKYSGSTGLMGQQLLNPPTVEGWHTGREWIDGGTLNERINFAVEEVSDVTKPGIREIIDGLSAGAERVGPDEFVERVLELAGGLEVGDETHSTLMRCAQAGGDLNLATDEDLQESIPRIVQVLQLVVSSREYQFA